MRIAVIDGQGGGIGKHLVEKLRKELPESVEVIALGTNALATAAMLRAGANEGATGENAVIFNSSRVDLIVGSLSIVLPNAMLGELTTAMAEAIANSKAEKYLLPLTRSNLHLAGLRGEPMPHLIDELVARIKTLI
ncbi:DUF3842 family protein [Desulforamulus ruminis]|uniref:DUF3842 family protein n=1 Tax=Desulforamulus ruminis (strain ATCC 23193 / DSM 2154 / NCIMB 8452 / DL) TaxID=696281 RepID=F6DUS1_DESRL|nr:DUF3842 family protein [Desulforamulus ruminis]AEG60209.1 hypothetical protein Desru_1952 [Desulforamulus ruminis DSM 2154]